MLLVSFKFPQILFLPFFEPVHPSAPFNEWYNHTCAHVESVTRLDLTACEWNYLTSQWNAPIDREYGIPGYNPNRGFHFYLTNISLHQQVQCMVQLLPKLILRIHTHEFIKFAISIPTSTQPSLQHLILHGEWLHNLQSCIMTVQLSSKHAQHDTQQQYIRDTLHPFLPTSLMNICCEYAIEHHCYLKRITILHTIFQLKQQLQQFHDQ